MKPRQDPAEADRGTSRSDEQSDTRATRDQDRAAEISADSDEIGIPSGYLERTFASKRSPVSRRRPPETGEAVG